MILQYIYNPKTQISSCTKSAIVQEIAQKEEGRRPLLNFPKTQIIKTSSTTQTVRTEKANPTNVSKSLQS